MSRHTHALIVVGVHASVDNFFDADGTYVTCPEGHAQRNEKVRFCELDGGKFTVKSRLRAKPNFYEYAALDGFTPEELHAQWLRAEDSEFGYHVVEPRRVRDQPDKILGYVLQQTKGDSEWPLPPLMPIDLRRVSRYLAEVEEIRKQLLLPLPAEAYLCQRISV